MIDLDPLSGIPIRSYVRKQYNQDYTKIRKSRLMQNFPEAAVPFIRIDEIRVLPEFLIKDIKNAGRHTTGL